MEANVQQIWDPVKEAISLQTFSTVQIQLLNHLNFYRKYPYIVKLFLAACSLIPLTAVILFIIVQYDIRILIVSFIPPVLYYTYIRHLQEEIILYMLCQKNNWPYNPGTDKNRIQYFMSLIPEIFDVYVDAHDQNLQEQMWGTIQNTNGVTPFWGSQFEYTTGTGKNQSTHTQYVYLFKLPRLISVPFSLVKTDLLTFLERGLRTESAEFNKMFEIRAQETDPASQTQIMSCLSPSVITRMLDFSQKYKTKKIVFIGDIMAIVLKDKIWKTKYTNFLKSISIDTRDEELFYNALRDMAELPTEMIQFIK